MKRSLFAILAVLILGAMALSACGGKQQVANSEGTKTTVEVPAAYKGKTNPMANDSAAAEKGKGIYTTNCASCHGDSGKGDGPAGASLDPHPGNLDVAQANGDDYLFWRISEGGMTAPFNSSMPAWKAILSEDEIWQVVAYIDTFK
ncbi:MAG: c-type cytochrome [Anaerolineaceae bacterium]|nr:c-type cytochrome [Anaerolineaceae bacterium]